MLGCWLLQKQSRILSIAGQRRNSDSWWRKILENTRYSDNLVVSTVTFKIYLVFYQGYHYLRLTKCFRPSQSIRHPRADVAGHTSPTCRDDDRICPLAAKLPTYSVHEPHWNVAASDKGTRATPQPCQTHCPAIVSLPLAITHFRRYRGCSYTSDFETKPSDLGVAGDDDDGVSDRSISCRVAKR